MSNLVALPTGTELVGDYRIKRVLGAGGFGITYLAEEIALNRLVTIKEYFPSDFAARKTDLDAAPRSMNCSKDYTWGLDRFIEEAQTLAKFDHPNIVRVYRYFRAFNTGYMVLHFEEGPSLKNWLKNLNRAPRQHELDALLEKLLEALQVIHDGDFLHRDIAPDNIIIRPDNTPVLIDFGSARKEIAQHSKTVSALVKPGYSPYEQYAETSRQQGPWTDIYALGATLYHAITGRRPPDSPSRMINDDYVTAATAARASYRSGFLSAIDRSLSLKIEQRPQSVKKWNKELFEEDKNTGWFLGRGKAPEAKQDAEKTPSDSAHAPEIVDDEGAKNKKKETTLSKALARASHGDVADQLAEQHASEPPVDNPQAATLKLGADFVPPPSPFKRKPKQKPKKKTPKARAAKPAAPKKSSNKQASKVKPEAKTPANNKENAEQPRAARRKLPSLFYGSRRKVADKPVLQPAPTPLRPVKHAQNDGALVPLRRPPKPARIKRGTRGGFRRKLAKLSSFVALLLLSVGIYPYLPSSTPTAETSQRTVAQKKTKRETASRAVPIDTRALVRQIKLTSGTVAATAYTDDGRWIVSATDSKIHIYWTDGGGHVRTIPLTGGAVTTMALHGRRALTGHDDGTLALWNLDTSARLATFRRNEARIWSVSFAGSPDRFLAASHDWKVALWDKNRATDIPLHVFNAHDNAAQAIAYSQDRDMIATGSADKTVMLWKLNTFDRSRTYRKLSDFVTALAFSPSGKDLAAATLDGDIRIWRAGKRRVKRMLRGHRSSVTDIAYTPDGRTLISSSQDGTIRFWNLKTGRTTRTLASHGGTVKSISVSPDGRRVVSAGDDGIVRIWSVPNVNRVSLR